MKKITRFIIPIGICSFLICLIIFSNSNIYAVKKGLNLWVNSVIPSLFPFFIASELLSYTQVVPFLGRFLTRFMKPIFNVPGEGAFPFIMGIISGYPVGAKIVVNLKENNICTREEAERLLAFTNNSGPLFIIGTVGICFFNNSIIGILLFVTHILACISVGYIFRFWKRKTNTGLSIDKKSIIKTQKQTFTLSNLGEILSKSIISSINTILLIGGFIILFCVIISVLDKSHILNILGLILKPLLSILNLDLSFQIPIITGIIELTTGCNLVSAICIKDISQSIIVMAFLLGFGGISIFLQVFGITSRHNISIKPYILGKVLQGILAATYTLIAINMFPVLNFNF
ncbi:MAG: sporulation integral membrane protein YlbJ [Clostridia bacterium]|nr:sporulation integral membrane protein YlbJ [Clostridia bacterium]